jgi:hypothetical protein
MYRTVLLIFHVLISTLLALCLPAAWAASAGSATALLAKRTEFQTQLQAKAFGEPLHLVSRESSNRMEGDVYAELALPYSRVSTVLGSAQSVCELLFLHLNVRSCQASRSADGERLTLAVGPKHGATAGTLYSMEYAMRVDSATADYLNVSLTALNGPLSTKDYRIVFEASPMEGQRTFLHFGYGYSFGSLARMAMSLYLATAGRTKIGFTVIGTGSDGKPQYVQGERGSLERNVIRNYLALQAYASVNTGTPQAQMDARLRSWFALTERHAAQLHELDLDEYLQEKHGDLVRMAAPGQ